MIPVIFYQNHRSGTTIDRFFDKLQDQNLIFLASELMLYGFEDMREINEAIERAMRICKAADIPLQSNFKRFYCCSEGELMLDWMISDLGKRLILINASPSNPYVAKIQMRLLSMQHHR
ncbi:MAG: hypothetical protein WDZ35_15040 [Crocinitomicaceae bacterium]